jgi:RNA 2',3'-cyclic 3'-phosphodiesterase
MRLFTAIDLPEDIRQRLERLLTALRPQALINWSPLDNLHITTKFIGEWPESRLVELQTRLAALVPRPSFDIELKDLGWFPQERSPRVFWLGVHGGEPLAQLAQETEESLEALGIPKEQRPYAPHLTLARIKTAVPLTRLREIAREMQPTSLGAFSASQFVLYRSDAGSNASVYRKLRTYQFASAMAAI